MDARHFDALTRVLSIPDSRRRLLALLATWPLLGGLLGILDPGDAAAKERRRRRKQRHQRRKTPGNRKHGCTPKGKATICAGRCGPVKSRQTCGKTIDCGSCDCDPPCAACQRCDAATQTCEAACIPASCCADACVKLQTDRRHCGACGNACPGDQTCQGGVCGVACGGDFCPAATEICVDGACRACDVCATCGQTTVQGAIDAAMSGDTIAICAGVYYRQDLDRVAQISDKDLTLIGAGAGEGGTTLDGATLPGVVAAVDSTSELRNLVVTGSSGNPGVIAAFPVLLTLTGVLVTGNSASSAGGILNNDRVVLNAGTVVTGNSASSGGGVTNNSINSILTLNAGSRVVANTADLCCPGVHNLGIVQALPGSEVEGCEDIGSGCGCPGGVVCP